MTFEELNAINIKLQSYIDDLSPDGDGDFDGEKWFILAVMQSLMREDDFQGAMLQFHDIVSEVLGFMADDQGSTPEDDLQALMDGGIEVPDRVVLQFTGSKGRIN